MRIIDDIKLDYDDVLISPKRSVTASRKDVELKTTPTNDNRSYHISSKKIKKILNFESKFTIKDAVIDLKDAFKKDLLPNSLTDDKYFNIKTMQSIKLV